MAASAAQALPQLGELVVGRYRLRDPLGSGGMGRVFRAEDGRLGRPCAVKFMLPALAAQPELRSRFEGEARTAGQLQLENVVAVTDCGAHAGLPFIVMELLQGEDLRSLLTREERLPVTRAVDLVLQACRGVHAVHAHGIVHRDLKPSNLFVTRHADGRDLVKVLDFGVAKSGDGQSGVSTQAGMPIGTIQYMPPEQVRGEAVDARADVYALGAVLYEALAGRAPFRAREPHALMYEILHQPLPPLRALRPDVPDGVCAVVARALDRHPAARPPSAQALARELEHALAERAQEAVTHVGTASSATIDLPSAPMRARARRRRWLAVIAAALLAAAAVWLLDLRRTSQRPSAAGRLPRGESASAPAATVGAGAAPATAAAAAPASPPVEPAGAPPAPTVLGAPSDPTRAAKRAPRRAASAERDGLDIGEVFTD